MNILIAFAFVCCVIAYITKLNNEFGFTNITRLLVSKVLPDEEVEQYTGEKFQRSFSNLFSKEVRRLVIASIFLLVLVILFTLMIIQFRGGKWLGLIAGITFDDIAKEDAARIGGKTGIMIYFAAFVYLFVAWWLLFIDNQVLLWIVMCISLILSSIILVSSLKKWIMDGY